ncbi:MAG: hypothetical protein IJ247_02935 [Bacilli bacterium]|nr:hypothetical protein [Bacilli bacterium]
MAYKMALLISMFFVVQIMAFTGDLSAIQAIRSSLDAAALTAGYQISAYNEINEEVIQYVYKTAGAQIRAIGDSQPSFGEPLTFEVYKTYNPLIIQDHEMVISVRRSAIIGYYF